MSNNDDTALSIGNMSGWSTDTWQRGEENCDVQAEQKAVNKYQRKKKIEDLCKLDVNDEEIGTVNDI